MKRSSMEKYCKRVGVPLIVMATLFVCMGQANAIPIVSTLGNTQNGFNEGLLIGQAFTTGQSVTIGTVEFEFGDLYWTPTAGAYLTIQNADGAGGLGSTVYDTWNTPSTDGNLLTYSGNYTLSADTTYWLVLHDSIRQSIAYTEVTTYESNYGASLPVESNNFETRYGPTPEYWSLVAGPTIFAVNPVPIPGAVWLFGSGLIGLVGIGRRRMRK